MQSYEINSFRFKYSEGIISIEMKVPLGNELSTSQLMAIAITSMSAQYMERFNLSSEEFVDEIKNTIGSRKKLDEAQA